MDMYGYRGGSWAWNQDFEGRAGVIATQVPWNSNEAHKSKTGSDYDKLKDIGIEEIT
jgi:hypothetical protein